MKKIFLALLATATLHGLVTAAGAAGPQMVEYAFTPGFILNTSSGFVVVNAGQPVVSALPVIRGGTLTPDLDPYCFPRPGFFCPPSFTVSCQGSGGAYVSYDSGFTNDCVHLVLDCVPPSSSFFSVGTHEVQCHSDGIPVLSPCSFTVTVLDDCPRSFRETSLVYESFEYQTNTQVIGQNGGSGWTTAWGGLNPIFNYFTNREASLIPAGLPDYAAAGGSAAIHLPANSSFNFLQRSLDLPATNGNDLWFSVIISASGTNAADRFLVYFDANQQISVEVGAYAAGTSLPARWTLNQAAGQGPLVVANQPTLLVLQMTNLSLTTHRFNLWVDPPSAGNLALPDATYLSQGPRMDRVMLAEYLVSGGGTDHAFDEFRIATNYADLNSAPAPCLQVIVYDPPACARSPSVRIQGAVSGCTNVAKLVWVGGDNLEHIICENCGPNPNFAFDLPILGPCAQSAFTVVAYDPNGGLTSTRNVVPADHTPPILNCASNKSIECGASWMFDPPTAADNCCGVSNLTVTVVDTVTNSMLPLSVTRTWLATDCCGNTAPCSQTVTVRTDCGSSGSFGWEQPPAYLAYPQDPDMHGGGRPSSIDWVTLMSAGTNPTPPNSVVADDFQVAGWPVCKVRWWGSYEPGFEPADGTNHFADGFILSFFNGAGGAFPHPDNLLGAYVAPIAAVVVTATPYVGWDSNRIYQFEVSLADTCLDHATPSVATPSALLPASNGVYWLAVTAEVGHRIIPIRNADGAVVDWIQQVTGKRATNNFWSWQTSPRQWGAISVSGHVFMQGVNWSYPPDVWESNQVHHMELHQAFALLGCPETFDGLVNSPLGGVRMQVVSNELALSSIGSSGQDGVTIDLGAAQFGGVGFECFDPGVLPNDASLTVRTVGQLNHTNNQAVATFRAVVAGNDIEYLARFDALGDVPLLALLYDGSSLMASAHMPTGMVRFANVTGQAGDARITPYRPQSGHPSMILEWPNARPMVTLAGGQPVSGTRLVVTPDLTKMNFPDRLLDLSNDVVNAGLNFFWQDPSNSIQSHVFIGPVSWLEVLASSVPEVRIFDEQVGIFGLGHASIGEAMLRGAGDSLVFDNPTLAPAELQIFAGGSDAWIGNAEFHANWLALTPQLDPPGLPLPVGAFLQAGLNGALDGDTNQLLAAIKAVKTSASSITLQVSVPVVTPSPMLEVWQGSSLVYTGSAANIATVGDWPIGCEGVIPPPCSGPGCVDPVLEIGFRWSTFVPIAIPGDNTNVLGDRIRIVADPPDLDLDPTSINLDHVGLLFGGGLPGLDIIREGTFPPSLIYQGLAHQMISNASLQVLGSELNVSNDTHAASYGTSIALGDASGGAISLGGLELPSAPTGSTVEIRGYGSVRGVPDQPISTLRLSKLASGLRASVDHTAFGAVGATAVVLDGSSVVIVAEDFLSADFPPTKTVQVAFKGTWAASGKLEEVIRFQDQQPISLNGGAPVVGDRILITPATNQAVPYQSTINTVSRLEAIGTDLPSFRITEEELLMFQRQHKAIGQARLLAVGDDVRVDNLVSGAGNPGGVEFPLEGQDTFSAWWRQLDRFGEMPTGAMVRASLALETTGGVPQLLGSSQVTSIGAENEISADFSPLSSSPLLFEVLRTGESVFSYNLSGATGVVARTGALPEGFKGGRGQIESSKLYSSWVWVSPQSFEISNQSFLGDEIRLTAHLGVPGQFANPVEVQLSSITLQASGIAEINLVADTAESTAPINTTLQIFGGVLGIVWDTLNPRQALQGADSVDGPWTDIPGASKSPYLLRPTEPKKFIRVIPR